MRCNKCNAEMFDAKLTGNTLYPLILTNKKKGLLESEKRTGRKALQRGQDGRC